MNSDDIKAKVYAVANSVTMMDVLNKYADPVRRERGRIPCPIHKGKDKNFSYNGHTFQCWVCHESGNAVSFVSKLNGIGNVDAAKLIDKDFGLRVFGEELPSWYVKKRIREETEREKERAKKALLDKKYVECCSYLHFVEDRIKTIKDIEDECAEYLINEKTRIEALIEDLKKELGYEN